MTTTTNVQDLIQNFSQTVSDHEIRNANSISEKVKKMYFEGDNIISSVKVTVLVMVAHDLEGEAF